jgi:hypothetical protein
MLSRAAMRADCEPGQMIMNEKRVLALLRVTGREFSKAISRA